MRIYWQEKEGRKTIDVLVKLGKLDACMQEEKIKI